MPDRAAPAPEGPVADLTAPAPERPVADLTAPAPERPVADLTVPAPEGPDARWGGPAPTPGVGRSRGLDEAPEHIGSGVQREIADRLGYDVPSASPTGVPPPERTLPPTHSDGSYPLGINHSRADVGWEPHPLDANAPAHYDAPDHTLEHYGDSSPHDGAGYYDAGDHEAGDHFDEHRRYDEYDDGAPPYDPAHGAEPTGRRSRREARQLNRAREREARWERHRFAVPYRTDGPKLTFGVAWFALLLGALFLSPLAVALLTSIVAAIAAMQVGYAWYPRHAPTRWWAFAGGFIAALCGLVGEIGVAVAVVVGLSVAAAYAVGNPSRSQSTTALVEVAARAVIPVAVAAASITALTAIGTGAALALVLLVSAYEMGDFIVGSGSSNAVEGPISGLLSMSAVVFILWVVTPSPFSSSSMLVFGALTGILCVLGQIFASAILPRGGMWAPALRRLDSYLLTAPLWVVLVGSLPTATTL